MKAKLLLSELSRGVRATVPPTSSMATLSSELNNVHIVASKDRVLFETFSSNTKTVISIQCSVIEEGECSIPVQLMNKLLTVNKEYVTISTSDKEVFITAELKDKAEVLGEYKLGKADEEALPPYDVTGAEWIKDVDPSLLKSLLEDVVPSMNTEEQKVETCGVFVRDGRFITTNTKIGTVAKSNKFKELGADFVIPYYIVPQVLVLCQETEKLDIGQTEDYLVFNSDNIQIVAVKYDYEFPYEGVLEPTGEIIKSKVSGEFDATFRKLVDKAQVTSFKEDVESINIKIANGKASLYSEDFRGNRFDAEIPGVFDPNLKINAKYSIDYLKRVLPKEGAIKFYSNRNMIVFDKIKSWSLIMPIYQEN